MGSCFALASGQMLIITPAFRSACTFGLAVVVGVTKEQNGRLQDHPAMVLGIYVNLKSIV